MRGSFYSAIKVKLQQNYSSSAVQVLMVRRSELQQMIQALHNKYERVGSSKKSFKTHVTFSYSIEYVNVIFWLNSFDCGWWFHVLETGFLNIK